MLIWSPSVARQILLRSLPVLDIRSIPDARPELFESQYRRRLRIRLTGTPLECRFCRGYVGSV